MTSDRFRRLALSLPDSVESSHQEHPDFRTAGKVFATLGYPSDGWAMVKLEPEEQAAVTAAYPNVFAPAKGAWGRSGSTTIRLGAAPEDVVRKALAGAHARVAPGTKGKR
jgi:hypothetical protein